MNKLIIAFAVILTASSAQAQSRRSLKDIDKELKQAKSTATVLALIESIGETIPQTDEDVVTLGQLMDKYPTQGQKALAGIKDPKLAAVIMKECDREAAKFKTVKEKDWETLPEAQKQEKIDALLNSQTMIAVLGNLKNKDALSFLRQYITPEYDGTLSYVASQAIGMIAPDDPVIFKEFWSKSKEMRNINYGAYRKSALKEVAERMQDNNLSVAEKTKLLGRSQIELRGASDAEEKRLLKDLTKNHPNGEMRETAGQSLMHTMKKSFEPDDKVYLKQWLGNENEGSVGWALYVARDHWDVQYVPELLKILKSSKWNGLRSDAAEILGQNKIKESLPYLVDCILKDKEQTVRGGCRHNYYRITGKIYPDFTPEDIVSLENYYKDPLVIRTFSRIRQDDPREQFEFARKRAFEDYKRIHK